MLKTISATNLAASVEVRDGNPEKSGLEIQVEDQVKKEPIQKSCKDQKTAKSKKWIHTKIAKDSRARNLSSQLGAFLTTKTRRAFTKLRQAFIKALILNHFDPERHIQIETDASGYVISGVFSMLTSNDLGQWYPMAFFSKKMILAKTWYETHNGELLEIVETFKTWRHYLEGCKHEVLMLTDYNNLQHSIDTKNLSSRQIWWAQKLSKYHFRIVY